MKGSLATWQKEREREHQAGSFSSSLGSSGKDWSGDDWPRWWSGWGASGRAVSSLSLFEEECFWLITLPSCPLFLCQTSSFLGGRGDGRQWRAPHAPPCFPPFLSPLRFLQMACAAHTSALCANHAHQLQIYCLNKQTHTHTEAHLFAQLCDWFDSKFLA